LQPLVKRHQWRGSDLLYVLRKLTPEPHLYPCWSGTDLASYRQRVLALPPLPAGSSPKDIPPAGFDVALQLCPPLAPACAANS
jgi:hypothetical protein